MDCLEFWIWEHASKHQMRKVLQKIRCSFSQQTLPNCWVSASFLREMKDQWNLPDTHLTADNLNIARKILNTTFKYFRKDIKQVIRTVDFIHLEFYCKAVFLVLRSTGYEIGLKTRAINELFPVWNDSIWAKIKQSFSLKNDLLKDQIKQHHSELRYKLSQPQHEKELLNLFGAMMLKHFPSLIKFLQNIKMSVLERIQMRKTVLDTPLEFVQNHLKDEILSELVILNLLEDMTKKRVSEAANRFLKEKSKQSALRIDSDIKAAFYTLPPDFLDQSHDGQIYPPCFGTNPFMPTYITLEKDGQLQDLKINRCVPLQPNGKPLGPHWFSDANCSNLKHEKTDSPNDKNALVPSTWRNLTSAQSPSESSRDNLSPREGISVGIEIIPETPDQVTCKKLNETNNPHGLKELRLAIPMVRIERTQSWVNNQEPAFPSPIENSSSLCTSIQKFSSDLYPSLKTKLTPVVQLRTLATVISSEEKSPSARNTEDNEQKSSPSSSHSFSVVTSSEPSVETKCLAVNQLSPQEEPSSNYQTPDQSEEKFTTCDKRNSADILPESEALRASIKRKLYTDDESFHSRPRLSSIGCLRNGRERILVKILDTMKNQSNILRLNFPQAAEDIDVCIARIFSSHEKISSNLTEEHLELSEIVKLSTRNSRRLTTPNK